MDAVEFLKNFDRMCTEKSSLSACGKCEASDCCIYGTGINPEKLVEAVEEWLEKHKPKTRQSEFLRRYPRAYKDENGVIALCPKDIDREGVKSDRCFAYDFCADCRKDYWLTELVKENQ